MNPDLGELLASWRRHLEAERKSPHTLKTYIDGVLHFLAWCDRENRPAVLDEATVVDWINSLHHAGRSPATAVSRQAAVRRFSKWLARKGHIDADLLRDLDRPKLDEPAVIPLSDEQLRALLATCKGKQFHDVRDRAMIWSFRVLSEVPDTQGLDLPDVVFQHDHAQVRCLTDGDQPRVGLAADLREVNV